MMENHAACRSFHKIRDRSTADRSFDEEIEVSEVYDQAGDFLWILASSALAAELNTAKQVVSLRNEPQAHEGKLEILQCRHDLVLHLDQPRITPSRECGVGPLQQLHHCFTICGLDPA